MVCQTSPMTLHVFVDFSKWPPLKSEREVKIMFLSHAHFFYFIFYFFKNRLCNASVVFTSQLVLEASYVVLLNL
jgi:hypothetical protein